MRPMERRRRAILRHRRRGTIPSRTSWLTAPDPFKVLQRATRYILPSEAELLARLFPERH